MLDHSNVIFSGIMAPLKPSSTHCIMHQTHVFKHHIAETRCSMLRLRSTALLVLLMPLVWIIWCMTRMPEDIFEVFPSQCEKEMLVEPRICHNESDLERILRIQFVGRLGNQLFQYASLYGISHDSCRLSSGTVSGSENLRTIFPHLTMGFEDRDNSIPNLKESAYAKHDINLRNYSYHSSYPHLSLSTYLQSYKYFQHYEHELRQEFKLENTLLRQAKRFMAHIRLSLQPHFQLTGKNKLTQSHKYITLVGIHQRRGDMINKYQHVGYRTADQKYFDEAMAYFRLRYDNVHFIACSDDMVWTKANIKGPDVSYSENDAYLDFAILTQCHHVIMSVGSFGWWAAWLAGGDVIYYNRPAALGSQIWYGFCEKDFFPPNWIGMPLEIG